VVNVDDTSANIAVSADARGIPEDHRTLPACLMKAIASTGPIRDLIEDLDPVSEILTASPTSPRINISQHPRILLAGDARQTVEPFTGEGVTFALRDGVEKASVILASEGRHFHPRRRPRSVFWVNRIYSPLLKRPNLLNAVLAHRSASPRLLAAAMRTVFR
jgi:2-polyprenyl-6-methoxyphenol hydroxylase-like FAD-dependent oxidoreductase